MNFDEAVAIVRAYNNKPAGPVAEKPEEKATKLKVGDYVRLKNSNTLYWNDEMLEMDGKVVKITTMLKYDWDRFTRVYVGALQFCDKDCTYVEEAEALAIIAEAKANRKPLSQVLREAMGASDGGVATFGIRFKEGEDYIQVADICHASMKWNDGVAAAGDEMIEIRNWVAGYRKKQVSERMKLVYDEYLHYMMNDSPWAVACVTKSIAEAYRDGISFDVNQNVSILVGAAIAIREGWEHGSRMRLFGELMDKGVIGNVAYLVSAYMGYKPDGQNYAITGINQGHMVLHQTLPWDKVRKFFREGYATNLKGIGKDQSQTSYAIFNTITGVKGDKFYGSRVDKGHIEEFFTKAIDAKVEGEGFAKKTVVDQACVDRLVEFLTKELA